MSRSDVLPPAGSARATEIKARRVKRLFGLDPDAAVEPFQILPLIPARLVEVADFAPPEARRALLRTHVNDWSAVGWFKSPATGEELISVNPADHPRRQVASLMEEIVHIALQHARVPISIKDGVLHRGYDREVEGEAYCVGAACVLPWAILVEAVSERHEDCLTIARRFGVSEAYVKYRVGRAGLRGVYQARQRVLRARLTQQAVSLALSDRPVTRVLLVEDEGALRRALAQLLEQRGFEVLNAGSGEDAGAIIRNEHVDVLVVDFRLGDMRGDVVYELASAIQPHLREQTLFTTGDTSEAAARDIARTRRPLLRKPFRVERLLDEVDRLRVGVARHQRNR